MIIASHNTLTFAAPLRWWHRILTPVFRCQTKDLPAQIAAGATAFDIRFAPGPGGWFSAHGAVTLDISPIKAIHAINDRCPGAYIRIILEKGGERSFAAFKEICIHLEKAYPRLNFFGGNYKPTWQQLHTFASDASGQISSRIFQWVGSMQPPRGKDWWRHPWHYWGSLFPTLWARTNRHPDVPLRADTILFLDSI